MTTTLLSLPTVWAGFSSMMGLPSYLTGWLSMRNAPSRDPITWSSTNSCFAVPTSKAEAWELAGVRLKQVDEMRAVSSSFLFISFSFSFLLSCAGLDR